MKDRENQLEISYLRSGYRNKTVLRDLQITEILTGKITVLTGPNAAGKSTLLRVLAGLHPAEGSILYKGQDLLTQPQKKKAAFISFMPQSTPANIRLTVLETVVSALKASPQAGNQKTKDLMEKALSILQRIGIEDLALEYLDRLSGGQRQMASLARTMVRDPEILLLDEPTSALDLRYQIKVLKLVRDFADEGRMVIMVLHDLNQVLRWADEVLLLDEGKIVSNGPPEKALSPEMIGKIYNVRVHIGKHENGLPFMVIDGEI